MPYFWISWGKIKWKKIQMDINNSVPNSVNNLKYLKVERQVHSDLF